MNVRSPLFPDSADSASTGRIPVAMEDLVVRLLREVDQAGALEATLDAVGECLATEAVWLLRPRGGRRFAIALPRADSGFPRGHELELSSPLDSRLRQQELTEAFTHVFRQDTTFLGDELPPSEQLLVSQSIVVDRELVAVLVAKSTAARHAEEVAELAAHYCEIALSRIRETETRMRGQRVTALSTLAAGVAHDFNNVLAAIQFGLDTTVPTAAGSDPTTEQGIGDMQAALDRGAKLVKQIMSFSRLETEPSPKTDLARAVTDICHRWRSVDGRPVITLEVSKDAKVGLSKIRLEEIVVNLLENAAQANPPLTPILVGISRQRFETEQTTTSGRLVPGDYAVVRVTDRGSGMDRQIVGRIFEPFFTTRPVGKGTGLGLSIVHESVVPHGGGIQVDTGQEGTSFAVYLPVAETPSIPASPQATASKPIQLRVLVVDDDPQVLSLMRLPLERSGHSVVSTTDPQDGLSELLSRTYHVAILDYSMSPMTGVELAAAAREACCRTPIVLLTGATTLSARSLAALPEVYLLKKPVRGRELTDALEQAVAQHQFGD